MEQAIIKFYKLLPLDQEVPPHEFGIVNHDERVTSRVHVGQNVEVGYVEPLHFSIAPLLDGENQRIVSLLSFNGTMGSNRKGIALIQNATVELKENGAQNIEKFPNFDFWLREGDRLRVDGKLINFS